jgi:AcrR family transcriptional regulator
MTAELSAGRVNQKERTRQAIIAAARTVITGGGEVTMPVVAKRALVSEATAYRYFPDLASLLRETLTGVWVSPQQAMEPIARSADPVERVAFATELLLREVLAHAGAVRAMMAAAITRPSAALRPGRRLGLIDEALSPVGGDLTPSQQANLDQLKRGLAIVVSAEALFTLTDLCGLTAEEAITSTVQTARSLTSSALSSIG